MEKKYLEAFLLSIIAFNKSITEKQKRGEKVSLVTFLCCILLKF